MHHNLHHTHNRRYSGSSRVGDVHHDLHHQHYLSPWNQQPNCFAHTSVDQLLARHIFVYSQQHRCCLYLWGICVLGIWHVSGRISFGFRHRIWICPAHRNWFASANNHRHLFSCQHHWCEHLCRSTSQPEWCKLKSVQFVLQSDHQPNCNVKPGHSHVFGADIFQQHCASHNYINVDSSSPSRELQQHHTDTALEHRWKPVSTQSVSTQPICPRPDCPKPVCARSDSSKPVWRSQPVLQPDAVSSQPVCAEPDWSVRQLHVWLQSTNCSKPVRAKSIRSRSDNAIW